jgi:hypothetical protein
MPISRTVNRTATKMAYCLILAAASYNSLTYASAKVAKPNTEDAIAASLTYADIAGRVTASPIIAKIQVRTRKLIPQDKGGSSNPAFVRALISAKLLTLIRGEGGIPKQISYLIDLPVDAKGRAPKNDTKPQIIFARPANRPDYVQLVSRNAQLPWSPMLDQRLRPIVAEAVNPDSPPLVTGIGDAFHSNGTVEGEGETQIFLKTLSGAPVSLSIIRRPGQPPRWGVSLEEVVDETAAPPKPNTLLWFSLACALPPALPTESVRTLPALDADAAARDYRLVMEGLGTCARTL